MAQTEILPYVNPTFYRSGTGAMVLICDENMVQTVRFSPKPFTIFGIMPMSSKKL